MRILTKVFLFYILISVSVFFIGGIVFYYSFKKEVYEELDEQLRDEKRNIERFIVNHDSIPDFFSNINFYVAVNKVDDEFKIKKVQRKDTLIIDPYEGEITSRQWRFTAKSQAGNKYLVTLRKSLIDLEDLLDQIISSFGMALVAFIFISFLINYFILRRTFKPFHDQMNQLMNFKIDKQTSLVPIATSVQEFRELNDVLMGMTKRIQQDYKNVKEFSENASHEIQTPLAIIKNKLELLMQDENTSRKQAELISASYSAASRLSKLNESLILLTRIENGEFKTGETVEINPIIRNLLVQMEEQFALKEITVTYNEEHAFKHKMNTVLAEIMFSNLLMNSIRHNFTKGTVIVSLNSQAIYIENSGEDKSLKEQEIFDRFMHHSYDSGSLGIGLYLVKKIAVAFNLHVKYTYRNGCHRITISK